MKKFEVVMPFLPCSPKMYGPVHVLIKLDQIKSRSVYTQYNMCTNGVCSFTTVYR